MSKHNRPDQCNAELRFVRPDFAKAEVGELFACSCGLTYSHVGRGTWIATSARAEAK